jgi:glutamine amidotransferase
VCRHLAWLGAPRTVAALVLEPTYGLLRQSYAPRRQRYGRMNADGWGVGFVDDAETVRRWRAARPLWGDASFASIAPALRSGAVLAAVRSATVGMPIEESACAPFTDGRWLFSHNGRVDRSVLQPTSRAESVCDSALLAATVFDRGLDQLAPTIQSVARRDPEARLTVLALDTTTVLGITWGDTLSYLIEPDGVVVASEPWDDDPGWIEVPDHHIIEVTSAGVTVTDLGTQ